MLQNRTNPEPVHRQFSRTYGTHSELPAIPLVNWRAIFNSPSGTTLLPPSRSL